MDLNNKNGQPSMEEILASIRRIIAEEPTAANPVIDLHAKYRNKTDDHDESNDFELPSIFRPATPAPERQPLFGRLTDAIRSASGGAGDQKGSRKESEQGEAQERYRGALRESGTILALANGQGGLDANAGSGSSHHNGETERYRGALRDAGGAGSLTSALSSLKLTRGAESSPLSARPDNEASSGHASAPTAAPAPVAAAPVAPSPAATSPLAASGGVEDVRRVMVPFRDMRMSRMSTETTASSSVSDASALDALLYSAPSEPAPVHHTLSPDFPAPPLQEAPQAHVPPPPQAYEDHTLSLDDMHRFAAIVEQPQRPPPPPPQQSASDAAGAIEDTTADLLRPMLRQWLSENMPRMVEKALSIELAESVKANRKFNGS